MLSSFRRCGVASRAIGPVTICRRLLSSQTQMQPPEGVRVVDSSVAKKPSVREVLAKGPTGKPVTVHGWVRSARFQKTSIFVDLGDGTTLESLQVVAPPGLLERLATGASVRIHGVLREGQGKQRVELHADAIDVIGDCESDYPLQKKKLSYEHLREHAHLRMRTNTISSVMRVRNTAQMALHNYFQDNGFVHINTPILTASDCEGAGEMFKVNNTSSSKDEFFGQPTFLTVSGQLHLETASCALRDAYVFGPTFRAENSHTRRHLAEFYMLEAEMSFTDSLDDVLRVLHGCFRAAVEAVLDRCQPELQFFAKWVDKDVATRLEAEATRPLMALSYTEAVNILRRQSAVTFQHPVKWGVSLQAEHERFLAETYCKGSVFVTDYPVEVKPFYMRANDDGRTVACVDLLVPGVCELAGGSLREERPAMLEANMLKHNIDPHAYSWYSDLRRYGTVPHGGFGMGFERFVQFLTGMSNIRDVIPYPRLQGTCAY